MILAWFNFFRNISEKVDKFQLLETGIMRMSFQLLSILSVPDKPAFSGVAAPETAVALT